MTENLEKSGPVRISQCEDYTYSLFLGGGADHELHVSFDHGWCTSRRPASYGVNCH